MNSGLLCKHCASLYNSKFHLKIEVIAVTTSLQSLKSFTMINNFSFVKLLKCRLFKPMFFFHFITNRAPVTSTLVVEVAWVEWPLNILVSISTIAKLSFNHLETVDEVTALWGFTKLTKTWDFWVSHDSCFNIYMSKVAQTHNNVSPEKL